MTSSCIVGLVLLAVSAKFIDANVETVREKVETEHGITRFPAITHLKQILEADETAGYSAKESTSCLDKKLQPTQKRGGQLAKIINHPWQASVQIDVNNIKGSYENTPKWVHICGAVLVSSEWLITAAYCIDGFYENHNYRVRLGVDILGASEESGQAIEVTQAVAHSQFAVDQILGHPNNIGVLKLKENVEFSSTIKAIDISTSSTPFLSQNYECHISGFGPKEGRKRTNKLYVDNMSTVPEEECQNNYAIVGDNPINNGHICIRDPKKKTSICHGDNGGPYVCKDTRIENSKWILAGVASWGIDGCLPNMPTVHTRVSHYCDFIEKETKLNLDCNQEGGSEGA